MTVHPGDEDEDTEGGDPACWAARVCPDCGRLADADPPTTCAACGRQLTDPSGRPEIRPNG